MPRQSKIPVLRHHRPSGQAAVRIDGRDHYLGKHGSPESREKYDRLIAHWLTTRSVEVATGKPDTTSLTISEMILAYYQHARTYYRDQDGPTGELQNLCDALRPLRKLYGTTPAAAFGPLDLQVVRDAMIRSGLARTTINARIHRVRRAFRWAASVQKLPGAMVHGLATVDPLKKGRTEAPEPESVDPIAIEAVEATLAHVAAPVAAMVRLQLLSGCRAGEVMIMRPGDLVEAEPIWEYRPGYHKGTWRHRDRVIPLGPRAQAIVRAFLKPDPKAFMFDPRDAVAAHHGARAEGQRSTPTPSELAKRAARPGEARCPRYDRRTYRQAIVRACDKSFPHPTLSSRGPKSLTAGQAEELAAWRRAHRWTPLQLRHTAATEIRARFGLEAAQVVLGHMRADTTEIYAERDLAKARGVMAEIG